MNAFLLCTTRILALWALAVSFAQTAQGFERTLELQGVKFHVRCANKGSVNPLYVTPSGRVTHRTAITQEILGTVTGAEMADLNADGWPELYVYVQSAGSGSHGTVVAYSVNRGKSVTPINLPELMDDPVASKGYMGHDEFSVVEQTLGRRFPVYKTGDTNASATGKRQVHYRLKAGEAMWQLVLDPAKTLEF